MRIPVAMDFVNDGVVIAARASGPAVEIRSIVEVWNDAVRIPARGRDPHHRAADVFEERIFVRGLKYVLEAVSTDVDLVPAAVTDVD